MRLPPSSHLSYLPFATAAQERAASAKVVARQQVAADISAALQRRLDQAQVPANQRRDYEKWLRFYLDICTKYGDSPALPTRLSPFLTKLAAKNQSVGQRSQAFGPLHPLLGGEFGVA